MGETPHILIAGVPLLLTLLWTLLVYCQAQSQVVTMNNKQEGQARNPVNVSVLGCPFYESTAGDQTLELLAYTVPVCAILVCNTVFLVWIMGVSQLFTSGSPLTIHP